MRTPNVLLSLFWPLTSDLVTAKPGVSHIQVKKVKKWPFARRTSELVSTLLRLLMLNAMEQAQYMGTPLRLRLLVKYSQKQSRQQIHCLSDRYVLSLWLLCNFDLKLFLGQNKSRSQRTHEWHRRYHEDCTSVGARDNPSNRRSSKAQPKRCVMCFYSAVMPFGSLPSILSTMLILVASSNSGP